MSGTGRIGLRATVDIDHAGPDQNFRITPPQ
jgi:hypothetical protein